MYRTEQTTTQTQEFPPLRAVFALCCSYDHTRQGPLAAAAGVGRGQGPSRQAGGGARVPRGRQGALHVWTLTGAGRGQQWRLGQKGATGAIPPSTQVTADAAPAPVGTPCTGYAFPGGKEAGKAGRFDHLAELQRSKVPKPNAQKPPQQPCNRLPRSAGSFTPQPLNSRIPVSLGQSVHLLHDVQLPGQPLKTRALKQTPPSSPRFPGCQILKIQ